MQELFCIGMNAVKTQMEQFIILITGDLDF